METDNISLDQVKIDNSYQTLYEWMDYLDDNRDAPLEHGNQKCKYYELRCIP